MVNLYDHGTNCNLLKTTIVPLENKNTIKIPKDNDATLYAICLVETYKYFVAYGEHNVMHFASKAIDIFMDMFDRHSSINTVLGPNDLLRNLLYYVHIILTIDENSPKKVLRPTLFTLSKFLFFTSLITARIVEWLPKAIKNTKGISTIFILKLKYVSFWDKILNEKFFVAYPGNSTKRTKITYKI